MKNKKLNQRGQALVMIALAIVGLVGFAALAIDGGNVFSDRRHSQNASDTAGFAAALALTRGETNWKNFGFDRAKNNGYDPADGVTKVDVYLCSELPQTVNGIVLTCTGKGLPAGADPAEYVYVHIKSSVKLFFAPVVGWRQIINNTDAVVHAQTEKETKMFPGYAIVSTMTGCPAYNHDPFKVSGSSGTTIINAGILVNSNCQDPDPAYQQDGASSTVKTDTGVCVVGDADYNHTIPPPGKLLLQKGIYCFDDGIDLQSTWDITTDLNDNGQYDSGSEGVFFYVAHGDITFNGSSHLDIHAITTTEQNFPKDYVNYLIYVPPTNEATVKITGDNGSQFWGTILAPSSYVVLNGGTGTVGLHSQIIGYSVAIEGNGNLNVTYNAADTPTTTLSPSLAPTE